ncbi:unnamed protein product [Diabrotica balteata]|uniref:Reverse transcriptase domain-containing protein n=1 Tax=Diabrotica balteata TaxID=107213 RepID=A0A9N9T6K0_DIABA|nr:unnamed protein product [Diabrotica balteata]
MRFAGDMVIMTESIEELQTLLDEINSECGMGPINSPINNEQLTLGGQQIERVTKYKYLGAYIKTELDPEQDPCYVWSQLFYGIKTWTLKAQIVKKLEAFELLIYPRMLRIPWTTRVTNEEVLRRMVRDKKDCIPWTHTEK